MKHSPAVEAAAKEIDEAYVQEPLLSVEEIAQIITRHLAEERREVAEVLRGLVYLTRHSGRVLVHSDYSPALNQRAEALLAKIEAQIGGE